MRRRITAAALAGLLSLAGVACEGGTEDIEEGVEDVEQELEEQTGDES